MITAKNYAAQAEKSIFKQAYVFTQAEKPRLYKLLLAMKNAVHFAIPDNGVIFDDNNNGLVGSKIRLPFPEITIEFFDSISNAKIVFLAITMQDGIALTVFIHDKESNEWGFNSIFGFIPDDIVFSERNYLETFDNFPDYTRLCLAHGQTLEYQKDNIGQAFRSFFEFIEAISCTNVEASIHQPASPKNAQRIKSHKLPIYETKVLTIKAGKESLSSVGNGVKGSHQSPRQHLRRGHIRRLEKGNIWVNSCVVGSKENGVIDKQYKVTD